MHQIRVHLAHLGSPVIGDKTYGDPRQVREQRDAGVTRQLLHAWKVVFRHPVTHQKTEVIAPLPIDFLSL